MLFLCSLNAIAKFSVFFFANLSLPQLPCSAESGTEYPPHGQIDFHRCLSKRGICLRAVDRYEGRARVGIP